ncbi:MAG TPA: hypothetical protein EYO40_07635 [Phycisphaerales bacterium]|nr:hypothetical protein [Phycisphaerales bacterium]
MKAIHRSDNLFYDEVSEMLTEKQRKVLGKIRIARELEAYNIFITELLGQLNRGARSQMRRIYDRLNAEPSEEIDAALDAYEQRYLKEVKDGFEAVVESVKLTLDQIDELGVRDLDQQTLLMRFMSDESAIEDLKRRGDILLKPLIDQAYVISQLNWKTWKKLDAMLGEKDARQLQDYYFSKSFYDASRGGKRIATLLDRAFAMSELNEGQRIDLEEIQTTFNSRWKKKTEAHADILEKSRKVQTIAIMSGDVITEFDSKLDTYRSENALYINATESKINNILGKQLVAILQGDTNKETHSMLFTSPSTKVGGDSSVEIQVISSGGTELSEEELEVLIASGEIQTVELSTDGSTVVSGGVAVGRTISSSEAAELDEIELNNIFMRSGAVLPEPIIPTFPRRASTVLDLEDNSEFIITSIYDDYRESYAEAKKSISMKSMDTQKDTSLSSGARMRKTREDNAKAAGVVAQLDVAFFDDIATITGLDREDVNLRMLENHRQRQRTSAPDNAFGWRGSEGDSIDLVGLYVMSDESDALFEGLTVTSSTAIHAAMQNYHSNVVGAHDAYVQATYEMNHLQDALWVMDEAKSQGGGTEAVQKRWRDSFLSVRDTKRDLMLVNQNVMDTILRTIDDSDSWKVRMEFVTKAYPEVFKKGSDATPMLSAAKSITTLDASQQSKLETIASAYKYDYWSLCERMIENYQSDASSKGGKGMMSKDDVHRQIQFETLRFERKEMNDRLQMRLRMVLHKDQIKHVPGLRPSVAAASEWSDW